jgi:hypothetical protein
MQNHIDIHLTPTHEGVAMKKLMILATITASLGLASLSQAGVISVNFEGGLNGAAPNGHDVTGTAGYVPVGNWNNAPGVSGTVASLNDDSGNNSGASVTWETHNLWDYATGDGNGGDEDMMSGYLDNIGASDPGDEITISGIPYDAYNVYVYINRDAARFAGITVSDGSTSKTLYVEHDGTGYDPIEGVNGYIISRDDAVSGYAGHWDNGNVILCPVMTGSTLTIDNAPNPGAPGTYQCIFNGIQIRGRDLTHEIQNGSFEAESFTASVQGGTSEIGTYKYVQESNIGSGEWGYTQPIDWLHPGWGTHTHMITDTGGTAAFPDGDYAMRMYDLGDGGGSGGVLEQEGIYLGAGKLYEFSVDAWCGTDESGNAFITVDLVGSATTTVMDNLTVTDGGGYETMTARFTAPKTELYTLQIYSEDAGAAQRDLYIDNVQIEHIPIGTMISVR